MATEGESVIFNYTIIQVAQVKVQFRSIQLINPSIHDLRFGFPFFIYSYI